jgi:hypothetical protein
VQGEKMKQELKDKLETVIELVDNANIDLDIDFEYCIPEVLTTSARCELSAEPYIMVKYSDDKYISRKIRLSDKYVNNTAEEIANLVIFFIEQFKEEIGSIRYEQG